MTDLLQKISGLHVVVVGDVMLDNYWWGDVDRISPEAPVPIVALKRRESRLGGAANVALNCKSLGAKVTLATVVGEDYNGRELQRLLNEAAIETHLVQTSNHRPTTTKTRVICRNQQMLRLDDEITDDLTTEEESRFLDETLRFLQIQKPDVVIFEDYNKGILKENIIHRLVAHCNAIGIVSAVDPKKKNFFAYREVTIFKPNLKEVREGLNVTIDEITEEELSKVHELLKENLHHKVTFITLSEDGVYYHDGKRSAIIASHRRTIADVSGAGDTVIATASLLFSLTKDAHTMAQVSNIAGGLVCEQVGVVPIDRGILAREIERLLI